MGLDGEKSSADAKANVAPGDPLTTPAQTAPKDYTERLLKPRHVQLLGIGGVIGTLVFVGIGKTLMVSGPASLLIAFIFW